MHVLLTGAAGKVGSHTLFYLLDQNHTVLATDVTDVPDEVPSRIKEYGERVTFRQLDLTNQDEVEQLVAGAKPRIEGWCISEPFPPDDNFKVVHNNTFVGTCNVMSECASHEVKRIAQASSINAMGVSFQPAGHQEWEELSINEDSPDQPVSRAMGESNWLTCGLAGRPVRAVVKVSGRGEPRCMVLMKRQDNGNPRGSPILLLPRCAHSIPALSTVRNWRRREKMSMRRVCGARYPTMHAREGVSGL